MKLQKLQIYINSFTKYPVSELFGNIDTPTPKQKKAEKRVSDICEDLYRFSVTVLSNVRTAYREIEVIHNLSTSDYHRVKVNRIAEVSGALAYYTDVAVKALETMHKKDPVLQEYYKSFAYKAKELKDEIKENMFSYYHEIPKNELMVVFDKSYEDTKNKEENNK